MKPKLLVALILVVLSAVACKFGRTEEPRESLPVEEPLVTEWTDETQPVDSLVETQQDSEDLPTDQGMPQPTATFNPKFSQLLVVYVKDGNLWRWSAAGVQQLTTSGDVYQPRLSQDGKWVAFLRPAGDFHVELWAIDANGQNERNLVSVDDLNTIGGGVRDPNAVAIAPYDFSWVPGTHLLAFNTQQVLQGPGLFLLDDFHLVNADTLELKMVLLAGWGGRFQLSPDGEKVALTTPTQIALADLDGSNYRQVLTYTPVTTYSDYRFYAHPVWKKDASGLWAAIPPQDPLAEPGEVTSLYEILLTEPTARLVNQVAAVSYIESPFSYSPNAEYLMYLKESGAPQEHLRELYIAKPDGSGAWMYQRDYLLQFVTWSVDSQRFVYTVGEDQSAWLGDIQAPAKAVLAEVNPLTQMRWIDADHFLFTRVNSDAVDLLLGNLASPPRLLVEQVDPPLVFDYFLDEQ